MTDGSSSSFFPDFGLLLYLEELNKEELNKFKSFLKNETVEPRSCQIPWFEVKKAKREDLANLMKKYYPGEQAWDVALKIFGKMNLKDLCERATAEINWTARTMVTEGARTQEEQDDQEAVQSDGTEYRIQIKEKFRIMWDKKCLFGGPEDFHPGIAQEDRELLEHLFDVDVKTGEQPQTVVLQGAAGVGKTSLVRKAIVDWAEGNLYQQKFSYVFYLNAREINQLRERSFVQMISKDWPSTEGPIERIMTQPSSLLFIIDSFDELNFAFEEPDFVLCEDWTQVHPVSFLMSSLLRKVMLPESFLLVTTRLTACKKLKPLLKNQHSVELLGMSKDARKEYIYQFFEDKKRASQVFSSLRSNEMLFSMCKVPLVCWAICTCLEQQIEMGGDVSLTCKTTTALFTRYISSLFPPVDGNCPSLPNQTQLKSLCHLAAKGVWTMTSVFYREDLRKHGLTKSDVSIFLDMNILQKDTEYENCYVFTHLHVQEFLAAMFYMLRDNWETRNNLFDSFEDLKLLLESKSSKDPHLMQMKCFLFGLLNEDLLKQLETTLKCRLSLEIKGKILQWLEILGNIKCFPAELEFLELFLCLYETQDEAFISQAMRSFQKVVIDVCGKVHLLVSSFCLKHCQCLQTIKLSVTVVFEKTLNSSPPAEMWQKDDGSIIHCWQDLCSVLHTNEHLRELDLCHSNLDELAMKTFYQELRHPNCKLQRLLMRFLSFPGGCQDIASSLTHNQNLMHLDLKGSDIGDDGVKSLCEALKHPECKLQNLSLESCGLTTLCCLNISKALIRSQSLRFLNLSTNHLLDDGVKLLCEALGHPKCHLERLSLESCGLTVAGCEDLSLALISNKRLTHLCLADNILGDDGVKLVNDALKHPQCKLQSLVLRRCHFTSLSSEHLSSALLCNKSLIHLDLGSNWIQDDGIKLLCDAFRHPSCNLQDLELMGCVLTSMCCLDLASAILNNSHLQNLDLGHNDLRDDGVKILCEALRHPNCNIQRLGLEYCGLTSLCCQDLSYTLRSNQNLIKINLKQNTLGYEGMMKLCEVLKSPECKLKVLGVCKEAFDEEAQKLLEAVRISNPHLIIKRDYNDDDEDGSWWRCP
ncbi:NACHT, LRR and PYD domains-containing protein 14 isoform X1 [Canis lupus familiaris]|uniref:NLR family pyrin domain containing 14 n=2 Tax=Canis lupus familiaris TaxID=9615 RepID=A0A8I3N8P2_CANLF|nr:NACHT, LRR and PYD domains-containing protein 14 isoform X1 [Canis lupus familiaris]XP_038286317.1 NACHT, LRR and PYD domains-containing protein 14 isoform X1 [Canis lupus familiaris]